MHVSHSQRPADYQQSEVVTAHVKSELYEYLASFYQHKYLNNQYDEASVIASNKGLEMLKMKLDELMASEGRRGIANGLADLTLNCVNMHIQPNEVYRDQEVLLSADDGHIINNITNKYERLRVIIDFARHFDFLNEYTNVESIKTTE
jgi:hypothetical protein